MRRMEYSVCHERGTKKKSESPTGIEPIVVELLRGWNKRFARLDNLFVWWLIISNRLHIVTCALVRFQNCFFLFIYYK